MDTTRSLFGMTARAAACSLFLAGSVSLAHAQSSATVPTLIAAAESPALNLATPAYSSSSSDASIDALDDARFNLSSSALGDKQPPPRRYGRPNYSDSHTNPDGSSKYAFMVGAGAAVPIQDMGTYLTTGYAFQVGAGRNFNKTVGVLFQFDYDHFGMTGYTLGNQQNLYNSYCTTADQQQGFCSPITNLDGNSHIWSFTLDPTFTFYGSGNTGAYAVGGVGFYHKVANFTVPATGEYCDYYGFCYQYQANETVDHYTSNAAGFNGGLGFTYKPSHFSSERLFVEARYVYIANQPKAASSTNLYPPNSNHSYYVPVTVGLRF